jgi:NADPH2:quinone reductase
MIVVGFASGRIAQVMTNYLLIKGIAVIGAALKFGFEHHGPELSEFMSQVYRDIALGNMDPLITARHPFHEFQRAAAQISERNAVGKIVLMPGSA